MHVMNLQNGNGQSFQHISGHASHFSQSPKISEWETLFKNAKTNYTLSKSTKHFVKQLMANFNS